MDLSKGQEKGQDARMVIQTSLPEAQNSTRYHPLEWPAEGHLVRCVAPCQASAIVRTKYRIHSYSTTHTMSLHLVRVPQFLCPSSLAAGKVVMRPPGFGDCKRPELN